MPNEQEKHRTPRLYDRYGQVRDLTVLTALLIVGSGFVIQHFGYYESIPFAIKQALAGVLVLAFPVALYFDRLWRKYA